MCRHSSYLLKQSNLLKRIIKHWINQKCWAKTITVFLNNCKKKKMSIVIVFLWQLPLFNFTIGQWMEWSCDIKPWWATEMSCRCMQRESSMRAGSGLQSESNWAQYRKCSLTSTGNWSQQQTAQTASIVATGSCHPITQTHVFWKGEWQAVFLCLSLMVKRRLN